MLRLSQRNSPLPFLTMKNYDKVRREKDFIGEKELDEDALYGIQSVRARENFPDKGTEYRTGVSLAFGLYR